MKRKIFIIIFLYLLALIMRFSFLSKVPISLNWDETTFAYNAYSILETGKDEYGVKLPLEFKSIGDYKYPFFVYSLVPIIKIFGLNEFAIRFLPAFFGSLSVVLIIFLIYLLWGSFRAAAVSGLFLAISPWHLQFTRGGADVGFSSFFVLLGITCFVYAVLRRSFFFFFSFFSFALALYTYYGERLFVPLILFLLVIFYRRQIMPKMKIFTLACLFGFIMIIPVLFLTFSAGHREKISKTTLFGYKRPIEYVSHLIFQDKGLPVAFNLFHNSPVEYTWMFMDRYLNHFSPSFLFLEGPIKDMRQYIYGMGMLYLFDLPFIVIGLYLLLKQKNKSKILILGWLLLAPLPAAITRDPVHARRAINMVVPLVFLSALGFNFLLDCLARRKKIIRNILSLAGAIIMAYFFAVYLISYYINTPLRTFPGPGGWQYGYKQLVEDISPLKNQYKQVVIDTSYQGPYSFFLFYEKYPPSRYQPQAELIQDSPDVLGEGRGYDQYVFRPIYWPADRGLKNTLFAGPPERIPERDIADKQAKILNKIYFPNGETAFIIVKTF